MAPRRNNSTHSTGVDVHNLLSLSDQDQSFDTTATSNTSTSSIGSAGHNNSNINSSSPTTSASSSPLSSSGYNHQHIMPGNGGQQITSENYTRCCVPIGDCLKSACPDYGLLNLDNLSECIRIVCSNENCTVGQYMHRECFENWEQGVLTSLKSTGRARSWSDRQRAQNIWTKKGYDLIYKACGCKCGRGHLKKDLDWVPPTNNNIFGRVDEEANKKKKKRNRNNQKPVLAMTSINPGAYHPNSQMNNTGMIMNPSTPPNINTTVSDLSRDRTGSLSSNSGSASPPVSNSSDHSISPVHGNMTPGKKLNIGGNASQQQQTAQIPQQQKSKVEIYSERVR